MNKYHTTKHDMSPKKSAKDKAFENRLKKK